MINSVCTSLWVNVKNLRFFLLQYIMLGVVLPGSYLVLSVLSNSGKTPVPIYLIGLLTSTTLSLFLNLHVLTVVQYKEIRVLQKCAVFKVRPLHVHMGSGLFHALISLPVLLAVTLVNYAQVFSSQRSLWILPVWVLVSLFLMNFSMALGGSFPNINIAQPACSMLYMIFLMVTPLYVNLGSVSGFLRMVYLVNPFSHISSLYSYTFGLPVLCSPLLSAIYLLALTVLLAMTAHKQWYNSTATEKLTVVS